MDNNLQAIKKDNVLGREFCIYGDKDNPLFLAKDIADMIDHSDVSKMVKAVDDDEKVKNSILTPGGQQEAWFLTEYGLYEVLMQSRKAIAKQFKKEVKEILKQLRTTGVVITESATEEAIDYQAKYGRYRIRRTFAESTNVRATYEEYAALSKIERDAKRIDNKDRIKDCKTIINVLEEKIANEILLLKPSELLAIQELISDVQADITKLHNKLNGGVKSAMTKRIQQLEEENEELKSQESDDDFYFIDRHPFSFNFQYSYSSNGVVKSAAYHRWINNLHLEKYLPEEYPDVDFTKPLRISLLYGHRKGMDTINFSKSIIDQVSNYYSFNDSLVVECIESLHNYVNTYEDGYIYIKIENIEED